MNSLQDDYPELFLNIKEKPCISLYQPTHRTFPEREQDQIRFKNLVKQIERSLKDVVTEIDIQSLMKSFISLQDNYEFWNHMDSGLAVFATPSLFKIYKLPRRVPELVMVSDSFHIKPLIRIMQSSDRFHILGLTRKHIKLYEGNRDNLTEVSLHEAVPQTIEDALGSELTEPRLTVSDYGTGAGGTPMHHGHGGRKDEVDLDAKKFFRRVDEAITKYHSRVSKVPLILAALPEYHHLFHKISENEFLLKQDISVNPDELSIDALKEKAWDVMHAHYLARLDSIVSRYQAMSTDNQGSDQINDVAKAAIAGRVETLLIDADKRILGHVDSETGHTTTHNGTDAMIDDVLDELGEFVLRTKGEVIVVPSDKMPSDTGLAAIYRY